MSETEKNSRLDIVEKEQEKDRVFRQYAYKSNEIF